jgi:hypothetical protein
VFDEKTATAALLAHVRKTPSRPSEKSELGVPGWLDDVILACLSKEPAERPQSAQALGALLEQGKLIEQWTAQDAERWWGTNVPEAEIPRDTVQETEEATRTL